jgi:predicted RNA-binding protein YlqC (UPF0109 family)
MATAHDLLEYLTRALVANPDDVEIRTEEEGDATILKVKVNPQDLGRLIGRGGKTAKALRELIGKSAACNKEGKVQVIILE